MRSRQTGRVASEFDANLRRPGCGCIAVPSSRSAPSALDQHTDRFVVFTPGHTVLGLERGTDIESWPAAVRRVLGDLVDGGATPGGLTNSQTGHCMR